MSTRHIHRYSSNCASQHETSTCLPTLVGAHWVAKSKAATVSRHGGHRAQGSPWAPALSRTPTVTTPATSSTATAAVLVQQEPHQQLQQPKRANQLQFSGAEQQAQGSSGNTGVHSQRSIDHCSDSNSSSSIKSRQQVNKHFVKALRHVQCLHDITNALSTLPTSDLDAQSVTALGSTLSRLVLASSSPQSTLAKEPGAYPNQQVPGVDRRLQHSPAGSQPASAEGREAAGQSGPYLELLPPDAASQSEAARTYTDPLPKIQAYALRVWAPLLQSTLNEMDGFGLAACLHAAVQLRLHAPQVVEPLLHACMQHVVHSSPRMQATMLWSAAQLSSSTPPPQPWLKRWAHASYRQLPNYNLQDIAMVSSAVAQLKWCPPSAWSLQLSARLAETTAAAAQCSVSGVQLVGLSQQHVHSDASATAVQCSLSTGVQPVAASNQHPRSTSQVDCFQARGQVAGTQAHAVEQGQSVHGGALQENVQHSAAPSKASKQALDALRGMGCTVWSLARARVVPPAEVLDSCLKHAAVLLQAVSSKVQSDRAASRTACASLAMLLHGLLVLQYQPSQRFLKAFLEASSCCMYAAETKELCVWAMALSFWRCAPHTSWMTRFTSATHGQLLQATPQGLVLLLDAAAQLGYPPPAAWMQTWETRLSQCIHQFTPNGVAQVVAALGTLGYCPSPRITSALWTRLVQHARHVPAKRWFPALLGAALLGVTPHSGLQQGGHLAGSASVLQRIIAVSREKLAHCHAVNVAHLAWTCVLWCAPHPSTHISIHQHSTHVGSLQHSTDFSTAQCSMHVSTSQHNRHLSNGAWAAAAAAQGASSSLHAGEKHGNNNGVLGASHVRQLGADSSNVQAPQAAMAEAVFSLLPGLLASARQKMRLAPLSDVVSLLQALAALSSNVASAQQLPPQLHPAHLASQSLPSPLHRLHHASRTGAADHALYGTGLLTSSTSTVVAANGTGKPADLGTWAAVQQADVGTAHAQGEVTRPRLQHYGSSSTLLQLSELQPLLQACTANLQSATLEQLVGILSACSRLGPACCEMGTYGRNRTVTATASGAVRKGSETQQLSTGGNCMLNADGDGAADSQDAAAAYSLRCSSAADSVGLHSQRQPSPSEQDGVPSMAELVRSIATRCFQMMLQQQQEQSAHQQRLQGQRKVADGVQGSSSSTGAAASMAASMTRTHHQAPERGMRGALLNAAAASWQRASSSSMADQLSASRVNPLASMPLFVRAWSALLECGFMQIHDRVGQRQVCTALYAAAEQFDELQACSNLSAVHADGSYGTDLHGVLLELASSMPHRPPEGWLCDIFDTSHNMQGPSKQDVSIPMFPQPTGILHS